MSDDNMKQLIDEADRLKKEIEDLKKLDIENMDFGGRKSSGPRKTSKKDHTPDWVIEWNKKNKRNSKTKVVVKTTDTFNQNTGVFSSKTELVDPVFLPKEKALGVLHDQVKEPVLWDRPTTTAVPPHDIGRWTSGPGAADHAKKLAQWLAENPGKPLDDRLLEGPTKPVRKQMTRLNKVWKYRNFKHCLHCSEFYSYTAAEIEKSPELAEFNGKLKKGTYDTWESRTELDEGLGVRPTHAMIWCYICGSTDIEVAENVPEHIRSWSPPKETDKAKALRARRQKLRRDATIFSLVQSPKTPIALAKWFRDIQKYEAVDAIMLELMLRRMQTEGLVVCKDGVWWEAEDFLFENWDKLKK